MERSRGRFEPLYQLRDEMDRLFSNAMSNPTVSSAARFVTGRQFPALCVWEDNENVYAECELPGVKSDELDITVVGNELTIKGRRGEEPPPGMTYHRRERGAGTFARTVQLPVDVAGERVQASLQDGVLLITLPKAEAAKPRKVQVSTV
jgi:HSP20 family protein